MAVVTVTAPGADRLPWDESGTRVEAQDAWSWNSTAATRWRDMSRLASQTAARKTGVRPVLAKAWEYQRRGVLHVHVIVGMGSAVQMASAHAYVRALDELRFVFDFGFVDRGKLDRRAGERTLRCIAPEHAARYLAKYLAPLGERGKAAVSETAKCDDAPGHLLYVRRGLSPWTMRAIRRQRFAFVLLSGIRNLEPTRRVELVASPASCDAVIASLRPRGP